MLARAIVLAVCFWLQGDKPQVEMVLPTECVTDLKIGPNTTISGPDMQHLTIYRAILTYKKGCEHFNYKGVQEAPTPANKQ